MIKKLIRKNLEYLAEKYQYFKEDDGFTKALDSIRGFDRDNIDPDIHECTDASWQALLNEPYKIHGGRSLNLLVMDHNSGATIGAILMKNEPPNLKPRDEYISGVPGIYQWNLKDDDKERLKFVARVTCVSPETALIPFIANISCSNHILNYWNRKYPKQHLVGLTTTSALLQGQDLHQRQPPQFLQHWVYCGPITTSVKIDPSPEIQQKMDQWMSQKYPRKDPSEIYKLLDIKQPEVKIERPVSFCPLYKNTRAFLRNDMEEIKAIPAFDNNLYTLLKEWRNDY
jgi:hypothetical protein